MNIPDYIKNIIEKIEQAGFEAYIVGGCVRDLLMAPSASSGRGPKDWDITTNARPENILKIFADSKYENDFGTVLVKVKNEDGETEQVVEVTTYRSEQGYSDRRHPDKIRFEDDIEKDLERRDFTINAMALRQLRITNYEPCLPAGRLRIGDKRKKIKIDNDECELIDLFGGEKDSKLKIIRAVGEPIDRFKEDALRMMRAIRFSAQLGFAIEPKTERAIIKMAGSIKFIAKERIQIELRKILESSNPYDGVMKLHELKLLQYIISELEDGHIEQNHHHIYSVFKHSILSLKFCPNADWQVRLAALLHDVGKPKTKKIINGEGTFYNHEMVGAKMTKKIMERLKFSNEDTDRVVNLVRNHMFYYNVGEVTESSVRRLIRKVGKENLHDLIDLRVADRLGSGVPKAVPYKLRHLQYVMEKVQNDPVSVKMLRINGTDLMELLKIEPSPKIGAILDVLLSDVIEDPQLNTKEYLEKKSRELNDMNLNEVRAKAKEVIEERREEDDSKMKKGYKVQ
jgi:tRNA nucleotidyltransferase (CCA-adding enzyme)